MKDHIVKHRQKIDHRQSLQENAGHKETAETCILKVVLKGFLGLVHQWQLVLVITSQEKDHLHQSPLHKRRSSKDGDQGIGPDLDLGQQVLEDKAGPKSPDGQMIMVLKKEEVVRDHLQESHDQTSELKGGSHQNVMRGRRSGEGYKEVIGVQL